MKVLFANPPWWQTPDCTGKIGVRAGSRCAFMTATGSSVGHPVFGDYLPAPLFMGHAASYVAAKTGAGVDIRDSIARRESYGAFLAHILASQPDYLFFETADTSLAHDISFMHGIGTLPNAPKIVACGPIGPEMANTLADCDFVTAIILGEYEKGAVRALHGETGIIGHDFLTCEEMNAAPLPMFDDGSVPMYFDGNPAGIQYPFINLWTSRGCPYHCLFCTWPAIMTSNDPEGTKPRRVRNYSGAYVGNMVEFVRVKYGMKSVFFDDDTFNVSEAHVREICGVMRLSGMPWGAMCRADGISRDCWREMKDAGCFGVKLGFESGNQYVIDHIIGKKLDLQKARETVIFLREIGLSVHGTFSYGHPGETYEQRLETRAYMASLPLTSMQETTIAELDGTPIHRLRDVGHLDRYDGAKFADNAQRQKDVNRTQGHIDPHAFP